MNFSNFYVIKIVNLYLDMKVVVKLTIDKIKRFLHIKYADKNGL